MLYMYHLTGDALAQVHVQTSRGWQKAPGNPFHTLHFALIAHHWDRWRGVINICALAMSAWLIKIGKQEYGLYLAGTILLALSGGMSAMPRYIWWQPPFIFGIYLLLKRFPQGWTIYLAFSAGMACFLVESWLLGRTFVI